MNPFRLDGRVAIVTGGGGGLGGGICAALSAAGAAVAVAGRTREKLERVATAVNEQGGRALAGVNQARGGAGAHASGERGTPGPRDQPRDAPVTAVTKSSSQKDNAIAIKAMVAK